MQETIKAKINKIQQLKNKAYDYEIAIQDVRKEQKKANACFESEINDHKKSIESTLSDISDVKNSIIKAELVDIIDTQAKNWEINPDEINVQCSIFSYDPALNNHLLKTNTSSPYIFVQVQLTPPATLTNMMPIVFTCKYNGFEPQKDGKILLQHTTIKFKKNPLKQTSTNIEFDDYKQLITQFTFNDLFIENTDLDLMVVANPLANVIIESADKYVEKQSSTQEIYKEKT